MNEELINILPIPKILSVKNNNSQNWEYTEKKLGFIFPSDYKEFIELYGAGVINDFLWIYSPFSINENINILNKFEILKCSYNAMKKSFPNDYKLEFYNGRTGLFPWGITDDGDELYWLKSEKNMKLVIFERQYENMLEYDMNMTTFLMKILTKQIICDFMPSDFTSYNNRYTVVE
jgi:hypothetical protein